MSLALISVGMWAWTEKGYISGFTKMATFKIDPASFVIIIGCMIFIVSCLGALGSLRENKGVIITVRIYF